MDNERVQLLHRVPDHTLQVGGAQAGPLGRRAGPSHQHCARGPQGSYRGMALSEAMLSVGENMVGTRWRKAWARSEQASKWLTIRMGHSNR